MPPIAFAAAAFISLALLAVATEAVAATVVVQGGAGVDVRLTDMRTGETRTVRTDETGHASFRGLQPGAYKVESPESEPQYKEVTDTEVVAWQVVLDEGGPLSQTSGHVDSLPPGTREGVEAALDGATGPEAKASALEGQIRKAEKNLARALTANQETPGLFDIAALVRALNTLQMLRSHYLYQAHGTIRLDQRQSASDGQQLEIQPWQRWESPFQSYFGALAGAERLEMPRVGIGTVITGGGERALLRSDGHLTAATGGVQLGYNVGGFGPLSDARLVASYSYLTGDADDSASEPAGGSPVAITYHQPAPNASTGLGLGATGLRATEEVEVSAHRVTLGVAGDIPLGAAGPFSLSPFVGLKFERFEQDYHGTLQSLTFADISSTTDQTVEETYIGPSAGLYLGWQPTPSTRLSIGGKVDLLHRSSDLDSLQANRCGLCAAPEDEYDASVSDSDDGWTYRLNLTASLDYRLGDRISIGAQAGIRYVEERGAERNPANPSESDTHLGAESATDSFVIGRARLSF